MCLDSLVESSTYVSIAAGGPTALKFCHVNIELVVYYAPVYCLNTHASLSSSSPNRSYLFYSLMGLFFHRLMILLCSRVLLFSTYFQIVSNDYSIFFYKTSPYDKKYGSFSERERLQMLEETNEMFDFAYKSYMNHAFPQDELNPIDCEGRGPDYANPYVYS